MLATTCSSVLRFLVDLRLIEVAAIVTTVVYFVSVALFLWLDPWIFKRDLAVLGFRKRDILVLEVPVVP